MKTDISSNTLLNLFSIEAGGEASKEMDPLVMSCGGIFIPYKDLPMDITHWQQVVNLPGEGISARMFEMTLDLVNPLENFLRKENLN